MNHLMNFIRDNLNWRLLLTQPPYNLIIKEDSDFPNVYLFKYNQYDSDMSNPICKEARGIILEIIDTSVKILCHSFDKFFNYSEENGKIDLQSFNWGNYSFQEKKDGSLMRLWYYKGKWNISSSGTIDAFKAEIQIPSCPYNSFGDMFKQIFDSYNEDLNNLNKTFTYSFEMTSPNNKIVVNYEKDELTLIGIRDNIKNKELIPLDSNPFKNIKTPNTYQFSSIDEALSSINEIPNFEGLVLCDNNFTRVKIKTTEYLSLAKVMDLTSSDRGILKLILEDKLDDLPELPNIVKERIQRIKDYIRSEVEAIFILYQQIDFTQDRKTLALQLKGNPYSSFVFKKLDNSSYDFVEDYFRVENLEKIYKSYKEKMSLFKEGK